MFAIRHRIDGMFWLAPSEPQQLPFWQGWSKSPTHARRFVSEDDAFSTAYRECQTPVSDLVIAELEESAEAAA